MTNDPDYRIGSLHRGIQALLAFIDHPEMTFSEFKEQLNLSNATAKRVLYTLHENRLIRLDEKENRYYLGIKAFELGVAAAKTHTLLQISIKYMETVANEVGETVILSKYDEGDQLYLHKTEPLGGLKVLTPDGRRQPLHYGLGRTILAFLEEHLWEQYVPHEIPSYSMRTVVNRDEFIEDLRRIRRKGYAVERGEYREGVVGVAVPLFTQASEVWGLLGVALPNSRFNEDKEKLLVTLLTKASKAITLETAR